MIMGHLCRTGPFWRERGYHCCSRSHHLQSPALLSVSVLLSLTARWRGGTCLIGAHSESSLLGCAWVSGAQLCNDEWLFAMCMLCIFSKFAALTAGAAGGESWRAVHVSWRWWMALSPKCAHATGAEPVFGVEESRNRKEILLQQKKKLKSGIKPCVNGLSGAKWEW